MAFRRRRDIRTILLQFFQIATGAEQEHTAVPVVFTAGNVGLRGFQIRFLNELRHVKRHAVAFARRHAAAADIAIAGFWQIRHDAEGHQLAAFCVRNGRPHRVAERLFLLNDVVRRGTSISGSQSGLLRFAASAAGQWLGRYFVRQAPE